MKKILAIAALAVLSTSAYALDMTASGSRNMGQGMNAGGLSVGENFATQFGTVRGELSVTGDRAVERNYTVGVAGSLPVAKLGPVDLAAKAGVQYADTGVGANGYGMKVGAEAVYPLTHDLSAVVEVSHLRNESALRGMNGNMGVVGLRYTFK